MIDNVLGQQTQPYVSHKEDSIMNIQDHNQPCTQPIQKYQKVHGTGEQESLYEKPLGISDSYDPKLYKSNHTEDHEYVLDESLLPADERVQNVMLKNLREALTECNISLEELHEKTYSEHLIKPHVQELNAVDVMKRMYSKAERDQAD